MTGPRQSAVETYFRDSSALFGAAYGRPITSDTREAMLRMHNRAKGCLYPALRKISKTALNVLSQSRPGRCAFIDLSLFRPLLGSPLLVSTRHASAQRDSITHPTEIS